MTEMFDLMFVAKGSVICREGEIGDAMYIIRSGVVGIYIDRDGKEVPISHMHRGDYFGEVALITGETRTATVRVILDTYLYQLKRKTFEGLLAQNPRIGIILSQQFAHRYAHGRDKLIEKKPDTLFMVTSSHAEIGQQYLVYNLAFHLSKETQKRVLVAGFDGMNNHGPQLHQLQSVSIPEFVVNLSADLIARQILNDKWYRHDSGFYYLEINFPAERGSRDGGNEELTQLLGVLRQSFDYVLFNLPKKSGYIEREISRLSDSILLLVHNEKKAIPKAKDVINSIENHTGRSRDQFRVGISMLRSTDSLAGGELARALNLSRTPSIWINKREIEKIDALDRRREFPIRPIRALARDVGRRRIGLALGAGSARGWAHIGILKALEDSGIHFDMISGSSIGALVGSIYAKTGSATETKRLTIDQVPTRRIAKHKILDYTFPYRGLIKGKKALRLIKNAVHESEFSDLLIPTYVIAVDIHTGEEVVLESGKVCDAVRASISIPGIFKPCLHKGRWLVDGGLLNAVPADVLLQKGADIIIAVCIEQEFNYAVEKKSKPNIINVLSGTVNIVHSRATRDFTKHADLVLYPKVSQYGWDEFHKGKEIMDAGESECLDHIEEIKDLIALK